MTNDTRPTITITCNGCGRIARITCDEGVTARMINLSCVCGTMTETPTQSSHTEAPTTPGNTDAPVTGPLLTGSPAFPVRRPDMLGLTKREWFAGMAMTSLAADGSEVKAIAALAVKYADALIAALEQPHG